MRAAGWRVVRWARTEDRRWAVSAISDHPWSDLPGALAVARDWVISCGDEIERGRLRILVDQAPSRAR